MDIPSSSQNSWIDAARRLPRKQSRKHIDTQVGAPTPVREPDQWVPESVRKTRKCKNGSAKMNATPFNADARVIVGVLAEMRPRPARDGNDGH